MAMLIKSRPLVCLVVVVVVVVGPNFPLGKHTFLATFLNLALYYYQADPLALTGAALQTHL